MEEDTHKHNWVGVIETNSGIKFNIEYPTPEMVDIHDIATALGMICRYNGQIPSFYSVAEHSVRVAEWLEENGHPELALEGLMHDAAEAYIGDIVRPMKLMPDFALIYNELEQGVEKVIGKKFGLELWPMNPIVKEADKAVYEWEVENIRTSKRRGIGYLTSISWFESKFQKLSTDRNISKNKKRELLNRAWDSIRDNVNADNFNSGDVQVEEYVKSDIQMTEAIMTGPGETVRVINDKTGGEKDQKLERFDLIPIHPLTELARRYGLGTQKYEKHNWRRGYDWSLSYAALQRHLTAWWNGEDIDEETGQTHMAAVAWHAFALMQFEKDFPEFDDRYIVYGG